jgi:hypothetical protein
MTGLVAISMPGPFELIILALVIAVPVGLVVLLVWIFTRRK